MRLYLVRHGDAVSSHPSGDRPLSERGRYEARRLAEMLSQTQLAVAEIVHSGKARAEQTAQALRRGFGPALALNAWNGLQPHDPVEPIAARLLRSNADVMVVGHQPFLPKLAGCLLCGEARPVLELPTCAAACLRRTDPNAWRIEWLLHPGLLSAGYGVARAGS